MATISIEQMITTISKVYPSADYKAKLMRMSSPQIIAIYYRLLHAQIRGVRV